MPRLAPLLLLLLCACRPETPVGGESDLTVLAQGAEGYAQAQPGTRLEFPRDHGSHPDFRIEWWYLTANLEDATGRPYGLQWTLFRYAMQPPGKAEPATPWQDPQLFMAHLGVTSPEGHAGFQRYARGGEHGGVAQAGATAAPFAAWLDDWSLRSVGPEWLPLTVQARQDGYGAELALESNRPLVLQGQQGFSQKHPEGGGSYYYSQPFLEASGTLRIDGKAVAVTGTAWLDREWSSQFLREDQAGWDWFALHLDSGEKLMLFQLRNRGEGPDFRHGVLIAPDGRKQPLNAAQLQFEVLRRTTVAGRSLPLDWRMDLPEIGRSLMIAPLHPDQWMDVDFPYWEGAITVQGDGARNSGRGYMELTGYPPQ